MLSNLIINTTRPIIIQYVNLMYCYSNQIFGKCMHKMLTVENKIKILNEIGTKSYTVYCLRHWDINIYSNSSIPQLHVYVAKCLDISYSQILTIQRETLVVESFNDRNDPKFLCLLQCQF